MLTQEDLDKINTIIQSAIQPIKKDVEEMKRDIEELQDKLGIDDVDVVKLNASLARTRKNAKLDY